MNVCIARVNSAVAGRAMLLREKSSGVGLRLSHWLSHRMPRCWQRWNQQLDLTTLPDRDTESEARLAIFPIVAYAIQIWIEIEQYNYQQGEQRYVALNPHIARLRPPSVIQTPWRLNGACCKRCVGKITWRQGCQSIWDSSKGSLHLSVYLNASFHVVCPGEPSVWRL